MTPRTTKRGSASTLETTCTRPVLDARVGVPLGATFTVARHVTGVLFPSLPMG